jgi:hypothetical protein
MYPSVIKFISDPESWDPSLFDGGYTGLRIWGLDNLSPSLAYFIIALGTFLGITGESSDEFLYVCVVGLVLFILFALYYKVFLIAELVINTDYGPVYSPVLLLRRLDLEPRVLIITSLSRDLFIIALLP